MSFFNIFKGQNNEDNSKKYENDNNDSWFNIFRLGETCKCIEDEEVVKQEYKALDDDNIVDKDQEMNDFDIFINRIPHENERKALRKFWLDFVLQGTAEKITDHIILHELGEKDENNNYTSPEAGRVKSIKISGKKLYGEIPDELGMFEYCQELDLSKNKLKGTIYPIFKLTNLKILNLKNKKILSSNVDEDDINKKGFDCQTNIVQCKTLFQHSAEIVIRGDLQGRIEDLVKLELLEKLDLSGNKFYGSLPTFNHKHLQSIDLSANELNDLGRGKHYLPNCSKIDLSHNKISSNFNDWTVKNTSEIGLDEFIIHNNQLTGGMSEKLIENIIGIQEWRYSTFNKLLFHNQYEYQQETIKLTLGGHDNDKLDKLPEHLHRWKRINRKGVLTYTGSGMKVMGVPEDKEIKCILVPIMAVIFEYIDVAFDINSAITFYPISKPLFAAQIIISFLPNWYMILFPDSLPKLTTKLAYLFFLGPIIETYKSLNNSPKMNTGELREMTTITAVLEKCPSAVLQLYFLIKFSVDLNFVEFYLLFISLVLSITTTAYTFTSILIPITTSNTGNSDRRKIPEGYGGPFEVRKFESKEYMVKYRCIQCWKLHESLPPDEENICCLIIQYASEVCHHVAVYTSVFLSLGGYGFFFVIAALGVRFVALQPNEDDDDYCLYSTDKQRDFIYYVNMRKQKFEDLENFFWKYFPQLVKRCFYLDRLFLYWIRSPAILMVPVWLLQPERDTFVVDNLSAFMSALKGGVCDSVFKFGYCEFPYVSPGK